MTAAVIGYGRFGRFFARHLRRVCRVGVVGRGTFRAGPGVVRYSLAEAADADLVILAMPISAMRPLLMKLAPLLRPGAIVVDVCSVKELPLRWMKELLPPDVRIVGTHPLFGPDSAASGLAGKTIVLTPLRTDRAGAALLGRTFRRLGLVTVTMTPAAHDRLMARSLFLTQFLGRALAAFELSPKLPVTENARHLGGIIATSRRDSARLFEDMYTYNRFARDIPTRVLGAIRELSSGLP